MNQQRNPSVIKAIGIVNDIQRAKNMGDMTRYALGMRQLQLAAEEFEFKKRQSSINNILKVVETQSELQKEARDVALADEIRKAFDAGDMERADFLGALRAKGQRSADLQALSAYEKRVAEGTITEQAGDRARILGARGSTSDDRPMIQKEIEWVQSLGIFEPDEVKKMIESEFYGKASTTDTAAAKAAWMRYQRIVRLSG